MLGSRWLFYTGRIRLPAVRELRPERDPLLREMEGAVICVTGFAEDEPAPLQFPHHLHEGVDLHGGAAGGVDLARFTGGKQGGYFGACERFFQGDVFNKMGIIYGRLCSGMGIITYLHISNYTYSAASSG